MRDRMEAAATVNAHVAMTSRVEEREKRQLFMEEQQRRW